MDKKKSRVDKDGHRGNVGREAEPMPGLGDGEALPCGHKMGGRNLIVCLDGTGNQFGPRNTNVVELYRMIDKKISDRQHTWYNSGIGTYARPHWRSFSYHKQVLYHWVDMAIAWNFEKTVQDAYRWLANKYQEGDCIFLFGFSRGAFQVRVLAAMIDKVGLIHEGNEAQIPFAYELYADPHTGDVESEPPVDVAGLTTEVPRLRKSPAARFKDAFCREVQVHFVGAWDTVSSIGLARGNKTLPGTTDGMEQVCYFRHALALDERRVKFQPEYAYGGSATPPPGSTSKGKIHAHAAEPSDGTANIPSTLNNRKPHTLEVWFAGTHSDIGGGNVLNRGMDRSRPPLRWMAQEAGKIHEGQKIHSSFLFGNATYAPKASLPTGSGLDPSDPWGELRKDGVAKEHGLLEIDLYDYAKMTLKAYINEPVDAIYEMLERITQHRTGPQVLYDEIIETVKRWSTEQTPNLDARRRVLETAVKLLCPKATSLTLRSKADLRLILGGDYGQDGRMAASAAAFFRELTDFCILKLSGHSESVLSVAFSPKGTRIVSGSHDKSVRVWDAQTGALLRRLEGHSWSITSVAFSPDGKRIVSGSHDKSVRVWDAHSGNLLKKLKRHKDEVNSVAFSSDGTRIVSGSDDNSIRIWDAETGDLLKKLAGRANWVLSVAFSTDGMRIVSGSADEYIRVWDAQTGDLLKKLRGHMGGVNSVGFSSDETRIVSGSGDWVRIWDAHRGELLKTLEGHTSLVMSVAFSPDGTRIVSGSSDRSIRVWDAQTGELLKRLEGHTDWVLGVAFSSDGRHIVSGSHDKSIRVWDVADLTIISVD